MDCSRRRGCKTGASQREFDPPSEGGGVKDCTMAEFRENKDIQRPFLSTPDARVYFPASIVEKARRDVERCLKRGEGVALVVGDAGVGKTLLARVVASHFGDDDLVSIVTASRKFSVKAFLQQLLFGFRQSQSFVGIDETELRLMTLDYLEHAPQKRRVVLIDDAQNLTLRVFDELRMLVDRSEPPAQLAVALFGTSALEERLNLPQLYPFAQRVVIREWLDAFTRDETDRFITRELKRADANAKFTRAAKKAVAEYSEGSPRVVVQLCDRALFLAQENATDAEEKADKKPRALEIDEDGVKAAWRDLQSIAEEASESFENGSGDDVVEFGELDDDEPSGYDKPVEAPAEATNASEQNANNPDARSATTVVADAGAPSGDGGVFSFEPNANGAGVPTISAGGDSDDGALSEERRRAAKAFWDQKDERRDEEEPLEGDLDAQDAMDESPAPQDIDASIEARLLAKLDARDAAKSRGDDKAVDVPAVREPKRPIEPMNFELVTEDGRSYKGTFPRPVAGSSDATFVRPDGSGVAQKRLPSLWDKGGAFDEALEMDSAYPPIYQQRKSVTRVPIDGDDDGSEAFRKANGFLPGDAARVAAGDDGIAARLAELDEINAQLDSRGSQPSSADADAERSLEERAYRQIVASCYRSASDFPASEQYLNELRLLEQEIAEEANLIRRIRKIHLQLRAVRDPGSDDPSTRPDGLPGSTASN